MSNGNARQAAFRSAVQGGQQARGAAGPVTTRAQALSGVFGSLQRADNLPDSSSKASKNPDTKKAKDDIEVEKDQDGTDVELQSAGSGGDFKPMGGKEDGFDANADATTPADNSTGAPETPSGF